jgi:RNA-directed DNA polymerase
VGRPLGFKTLIRPSASAQRRHLADLADVIRHHQQSRTADLVAVLNRKVGGWANYYSAQVSKQVFSRMDHLVYEKLKRWAERRHPTKAHGWVRHHYWHHAVQQDPEGYDRIQRWVFGQRDGPVLALHANTVIRRHTKVEKDRSPFDGDVRYWASRLGRHPELPNSKAILLKRQHGRCAWCGRLFQTMDELTEVDHIQPLVQQGANELANRQLLHGHCHDAKTADDGTNQSRLSVVPMPRAKKKAARRQIKPGTMAAKYCRGAG